MAFNKHTTVLKSSQKVSGTNRYATCDRVLDGDITRLAFRRYRGNLSSVGKYKQGQVPHGRTSRPDLMAFVAYGSVSLYWVLYYFNRALCRGPFRFVQDTLIVLPHPTRITKWLGQGTV
jgi:hypothetical protein